MPKHNRFNQPGVQEKHDELSGLVSETQRRIRQLASTSLQQLGMLAGYTVGVQAPQGKYYALAPTPASRRIATIQPGTEVVLSSQTTTTVAGVTVDRFRNMPHRQLPKMINGSKLARTLSRIVPVNAIDVRLTATNPAQPDYASRREAAIGVTSDGRASLNYQYWHTLPHPDASDKSYIPSRFYYSTPDKLERAYATAYNNSCWIAGKVAEALRGSCGIDFDTTPIEDCRAQWQERPQQILPDEMADLSAFAVDLPTILDYTFNEL